MQMLTAELKQRLPPLYATEGADDPVAIVKYFQPWGAWTWYAWEASAVKEDGTEVALKDMGDLSEYEDVRFFGWVKGQHAEMGYFSLRELMALTGPAGLRIERDLHFKPTPLSEIKARHV